MFIIKCLALLFAVYLVRGDVTMSVTMSPDMTCHCVVQPALPPPTTPPTTTTTAAPPLPGYTRIPGLGCYHYHHTATTWPTAKQACEDEGGHLVVLNSQQEADAMVRLHEQHKGNVTRDSDPWSLWVGVIESNTTENEFHTVLGGLLSETGFTRWDSDRPEHGSLGDHVALFTVNGSLADIRAQYNYELPYACEQLRC